MYRINITLFKQITFIHFSSVECQNFLQYHSCLSLLYFDDLTKLFSYVSIKNMFKLTLTSFY